MVAFRSAEKAQTGTSDPILTRLADEDKVPWYRKPNLRLLYFLLLPTCMGIELTSGFDSQLINALQIVPSWIACEFIIYFLWPKIVPSAYLGCSVSWYGHRR